MGDEVLARRLCANLGCRRPFDAPSRTRKHCSAACGVTTQVRNVTTRKARVAAKTASSGHLWFIPAHGPSGRLSNPSTSTTGRRVPLRLPLMGLTPWGNAFLAGAPFPQFATHALSGVDH